MNKQSALLTDLYQLTMTYGYFREGKVKEPVVFDLFFRKLPPGSGYVLAAGLEQVVEYLQGLRFTDYDLSYLASLNMFSPQFLDYLKNFRFTGDLWAIPEGTPVFPQEPLMRLKAPIGQAQIVETALLNMVNFQSLIATKACRINLAAKGDPVMEFGLRRAHGPDAGVYGARAAMIGGCVSTSNVRAGQLFHVPVSGTMAHSWVQSFSTELEAFRAYADAFPENCLLLVDTYNVLQSGVPNALTVAAELRLNGYELKGIRIDSGDLAYLSRQARTMLDQAGFPQAGIVASNDLDEETIQDIKTQGAPISAWGVGTALITSRNYSALGGVYKLSAVYEAERWIPKLKISENSDKITLPGIKQVLRFFGATDGMAMADLITLEGEEYTQGQPLTIFHPIETWKRKTLQNFVTQKLLVQVMADGQLIHDLPSVLEIQAYAKQQQALLWDEHKRLKFPQQYIVDLSKNLWELRANLISAAEPVSS
ncbi:MAG: nicotinate phosphoribosyltransferase [Peptococcaceae bacterium]|nr:nicotinate phosphoribosyltransferase [Peptococcaceae bacterium]